MRARASRSASSLSPRQIETPRSVPSMRPQAFSTLPNSRASLSGVSGSSNSKV